MDEKCEICGSRHHPRQAHVWPETKTAAAPLAPKLETEVSEKGAESAAAPKFDRVAYQREYMRKWRANKRKGGHT